MELILQKAVPKRSTAFFVCVVLILLCSGLPGLAIALDCSRPGDAKQVELSRIKDGDTVDLASGQAVRLVGINTPEMNYRKGQASAEWLAEEATDALRLFVKNAGKLYLSQEKQQKDSYRRLLGHIWNEDGESAAMVLLRQGLAVQVAFPPNTRYLKCHQRAESVARQNKLGLWSRKPLQLKETTWLGAGFNLLQGKISDLQETRYHWWLEFDGPLVLKVSKKASVGFSREEIKSMLEHDVLVRGWVIARDKTVIQKGFKPYMMHVRHRSMIELQEPEKREK